MVANQHAATHAQLELFGRAVSAEHGVGKS